MSDECGDPLTLAEVIEFGTDRIEGELDSFDGEVPNHAARLLAYNATTVGQTLTQIDIQQANEDAPDPSDESIQTRVSEDLIHVILSVIAVAYEYDVDIEDAFEEHMAFVEDYEAMQESMDDAETQQEMIEAFDEHMSEHADENPIEQMGGESIEPGENVDDDDYDADDHRDRHFA